MNAAPLSPSSAGVLRFSGFRRAAFDLERSIDFYVGALGFVVDRSPYGEASQAHPSPVADAPARCAHLALGRESIELFAPVGYERHPGADTCAAAIADTAFHHIAVVTNDMDAALRQLERHSPRAISTDGPVRLPQSAGGVTAFKFRDPDGHPLELICFPPGVGDPRWQAASTRPTLGIDHSAITVSNAERSLAFYVHTLGFRVGSRQTNRGAKQARLDGCVAAEVDVEVDVIGLASSESPTPHLELLAYCVPAPRRTRELSSLSVDHADRMTFIVDDLSAIIARLDALPAARAAQRWAPDPHALLLRDDDGHLLLLQQEAFSSSR